MIIYSMTDERITQELEEDFRWIKENAKKMAKKRLLKLVSVGMASKDHVDDYELCTPNGNRWFVTANFRYTRQRDVRIRACCMLESKFGSRDYLILRGTRWGGTFYVKVISHVISRMKERNKRYRGMEGGPVCNRIFQPGETSHGIVMDPKEISDDIFGLPDGEDIAAMIATSAGVFFGTHNRDKQNGLCHTKLVTYIPPEMLATHTQLDTYRFLEANLQLEKLYCGTKTYGVNAISFIDDTPETRRVLGILHEYKNTPIGVKGTFSLPE